MVDPNDDDALDCCPDCAEPVETSGFTIEIRQLIAGFGEKPVLLRVDAYQAALAQGLSGKPVQLPFGLELSVTQARKGVMNP